MTRKVILAEKFKKIYGRYPNLNEFKQFRENYNPYDHAQAVRGADIVHKRKREKSLK